MKAHERFYSRPDKALQNDVDVHAAFSSQFSSCKGGGVKLRFFGDKGELWVDMSAAEAMTLVNMITGKLQQNLR